jgi:hypothetical protein
VEEDLKGEPHSRARLLGVETAASGVSLAEDWMILGEVGRGRVEVGTGMLSPDFR